MSARVMRDGGFADLELAKLMVRRLRVRAALWQARRSIQTLAQLLDQSREAMGGDGATGGEQGIGLAGGDEHGGFGGGAIAARERQTLREHELLQGVELIGKLLERIEIGIRHGLFSGEAGAVDSAAWERPHRLSGEAK